MDGISSLKGQATAATRDRLQQPHKGQATEANNGHSGRERWWWIRRGGPNSKEGEMEARVQRDRLVRFSQGTGSTAAIHKGQALTRDRLSQGTGPTAATRDSGHKGQAIAAMAIADGNGSGGI